MPPTAESDPEFDVIIVGGAFSGSALALLLKRARPETKILIVEKTSVFDRKVGESTSEVAGCFLTKILGLTAHLNREHIQKNGLRMWFTAPGNDSPGSCTEVGARFESRLPTYQLDRSRFDEHLLHLAVECGCELWRGATVDSTDRSGGGRHQLTIKTSAGTARSARASWIVDASGKAAWLSRKSGNLQKLDSHPINAIWARFRNVGDLDSRDAQAAFGAGMEPDPVYGSRSSGTNHLMGHGWWCWIIPLQDGDVSAGLVYDSRLFTPPKGGSLSERLHNHLLTHPIGKFLFEDALPVEKDTRSYTHLPYYSTRIAGDGWIVVGDAAGFIDPLYSQGLDYCSHTVYGAHRILIEALDGKSVTRALSNYDLRFQESYRRWYESLYLDKYHYIGDAELMFVAFLLDLSTYFIGPVRLVYENPEREFALMPYDGAIGRGVAAFMRFYNRRLAILAQRRRRAGVYGVMNLDRRLLICGLSPDNGVLPLFFKGLRIWLRCELRGLLLPRAHFSPNVVTRRRQRWGQQGAR